MCKRKFRLVDIVLIMPYHKAITGFQNDVAEKAVGTTQKIITIK